MITLDILKTKLLTTGYEVQFARDREVDLQEQVDLPIIYIGYASIDSKNPTSPVEHDFLNLHGEDLVQSFHIQIVCAANQLATIWKSLHSTLVGWNPTPGEQYHSGFTYSQGGMMGLSNSKLWWLDVWKIGFPTVNVNFTG